ncbi:unnamed protein product [Moneuplotes crassus]|uniref:Uncharacterized protein n=2 Tax=Euplotes crassus TaxID=5936 RepID=A0AAD1Y3I4_EUPCR|nr:unnamed protein product [Moneuplotes crassus]
MDDLFGLTLTFDPLKDMLTNILKRQNELDIELKLMKDSMNEKISPGDIEKTNSKLTWLVNNTENQIQKLSAKVDSNSRSTEYKLEQQLAMNSSLSGKVHEQAQKNKEFNEIFKDLEAKSVRTDARIDDHILQFENYKMHSETARWKALNEKQDNEEVSQAVVQKIEDMVDSVSKKVQRQSSAHTQFQDKIGDLETKVILLIQAAKNSKAGKDNSSLFEGVGDVVSAVDHLKEMMRGQYAQLTEFKECEQQVEILNKFFLDEKEFKIQQEKAKNELEDRISDIRAESDKLMEEITNLKEERFKAFENQLVEKVDYSEFEATVNNIQNYFENNPSEVSVESRMKDSQFSKAIYENKSGHQKDNETDSLTEDEDIEVKSTPRLDKDSPPVSRNNSRDRTPENFGQARPILTLKKVSHQESIKNETGSIKSPTTKRNFRKKKIILKKGPSFIPKEAVRMKEFERKIKDIDEKLVNIIKNSKNDIIPIIEKRLDGIREEIENKASKLDLKKIMSDVQYFTESSKQMNDEISAFKQEGLVGEKGKKIEEEVSLTSSKLAQLEGKFTWLHEAHKDLKTKTNESLKASQPLMMSNIDMNKMVGEEAFSEIREEIRKLDREISDLSTSLKYTTNDLKSKINEKVDDRNLNELEDQLTTDMDQIIRSFNRRFAEKQDTKKSIRHIERQIRVIHETVGIGGPNFMNNRLTNEDNNFATKNIRRGSADIFGMEEEVERSRGNPHEFRGGDPSMTFNLKSPDFDKSSIKNLKKEVKIGKTGVEKITVPLQGSITSRIYKDKNLDLNKTPQGSPKAGKPILDNLKGHKPTKSLSKVNLIYPKDMEKAQRSNLPEI